MIKSKFDYNFANYLKEVIVNKQVVIARIKIIDINFTIAMEYIITVVIDIKHYIKYTNIKIMFIFKSAVKFTKSKLTIFM